MTTTVTDFIRVADRASELGCAVPTGIAILPQNFATVAASQDFLFSPEATTIRKLLMSGNIQLDTILPSDSRPAYLHNKHFEWVAPLLFISATLLTENPHAVSVA
jgi:hypothetical protein